MTAEESIVKCQTADYGMEIKGQVCSWLILAKQESKVDLTPSSTYKKGLTSQ
jgi:hypothetical protein